MFSSKLVLTIAVLVILSVSTIQNSKRIYFVDNDTLVILKGKVKQMYSAPVDDINSTNPGQDYDIADFNEQGALTKITTGFHGTVFQTYYTTNYRVDGGKLETKGYSKPPIIGILSDTISKSKSVDIRKRFTLIYKYNQQNEVISYVVSPNKPAADSITYKYNTDGDLMEMDLYTYSKKLMDITKYTYNSNHLLVHLDEYHWNKLMQTGDFQYDSFDSENNWIKLTTHSWNGYDDNKRTIITERKITYYKH